MIKIQKSRGSDLRIRILKLENCFGFRDSDFQLGQTRSGFTVLELLIVISIIIVLAGLILATTGYVQNKAARSRAEAEIAAMSAACESYKADNGVYPSGPETDSLQTTGSIDNTSASGTYAKATLDLYTLLSGDTAHDGSAATTKAYMAFKPQMLGRAKRSDPVGAGNLVAFIADPFGNSYGYSTSQAKSQTGGYNPTFDVWSTAGLTTGSTVSVQNQWVKNW